MAVTAAQAIANYNAHHNVAAQVVADTAANLINNLSGLQTLQTAGKLASVTLTGSANTVTGGQATSLAALPKFALASGAKLVVADTAANLLLAANAAGVGKATTVQLTGTANTVTAAQARTLAGLPHFALASGATLVVADTAANLLLAANAAGVGKATTVQLTGAFNKVTAAQARTLAGLPHFALASGATLVVADTAANLLLAANAAGVGKATTVQLTGAFNKVTAAQATALAGKPNFSLASGATLVVADSATDLLDSANASGVGKATTVQLTGSNTVSAAQASTLSGLPNFTFATGSTLRVSDSSTNVAANFDKLQTLAASSKLTSIALTDTNPLAITYAQLTSDTAALGKLPTTYKLVVSGVPAANANVVQANSYVTSFSVSDTAANVAGALAALNGDSKVTAIAFTDSGPPSLSISYTQYTNDSTAIGKFSGSYGLMIGGAPVSAAATLQGASAVTSFSISDTAANVAAGLSALNGDSKLTAIAFTDSGTSQLSISYTQYTNDSTALAKVTGSYGLSVSNAPVSVAATLQADSHVMGFSISDSATNVAGALDALNGDSKINSIFFTDNSMPLLSITYTQFTNDSTAIGKFSGSYGLIITGAPVSAAAGLQSNAHVMSFSISDTAANVAAGLDALNGDSDLSAISLVTPPLSLADITNPTIQFYNPTNGHIYEYINSAINWTQSQPLAASRSIDGNAGYLATITSGSEQDFVVSHMQSVPVNAYWLGGTQNSQGTWSWVNGPEAGQQFWQGEANGTSIGNSYNNWDLQATLPQPNSPNENYLIINVDIGGYGLNPGKWADASNFDSWGYIIEYGGIPSINITYGQYITDVATLGNVSNSYSLSVSETPVSAASDLESSARVDAFSVSDTVANVSGNLGALNGDAKLSSVVITGTGGADSLDLTGFTKQTMINLDGNTAFVSDGLSSPNLTFIGTPDAVTLGSASATVDYTLQSSSGIESIANFQYGLDRLDINLNGAMISALEGSDTTVNGAPAISLYSSADPTHGLVLTGMGGSQTASNLISSHLTFSNGHGIIM